MELIDYLADYKQYNNQYKKETYSDHKKPIKNAIKQSSNDIVDILPKNIYNHKTIYIDARLIGNGKAEFVDKKFYNYLNDQSISLEQISDNVKRSFNNNGFFFYTKHKINYLDKAGLPCDYACLLGRTCRFKIKLSPYKTDECASMSIHVMEIRY